MTESAFDMVSKLADHNVFGSIKSMSVSKSTRSRGYLLKVIFFVNPAKDAAPEVVKFKCRNSEECGECINLIINSHQEVNPDSLSLMQDWRVLTSEFIKNPECGLSLYLPG